MHNWQINKESPYLYENTLDDEFTVASGHLSKRASNHPAREVIGWKRASKGGQVGRNILCLRDIYYSVFSMV